MYDYFFIFGDSEKNEHVLLSSMLLCLPNLAFNLSGVCAKLICV
jgi:hypothetical protein